MPKIKLDKLQPSLDLTRFNVNESVNYMDLQPRALMALKDFLQPRSFKLNQILLLKSSVEPALCDLLVKYLTTISHKNVTYLSSLELEFNTNNINQQLAKLLNSADDNAIVILKAQSFLHKSSLKYNLFNHFIELIYAQKITTKLVILGSRDELATLEELDFNFYRSSQYGEFCDYYNLFTANENLNLWENYLKNITQSYFNFVLSDDAINAIYAFLVRYSGDRSLINIGLDYNLNLLQNIILGIDLTLSQSKNITAQDVENYIKNLLFKQSYLYELSLFEQQSDQIKVQTSGAKVGQINALSVIEYDGLSEPFGMPSRLSCVVQRGEGEILDIDRKNELAGNIHSKGMMIAQAALMYHLKRATSLEFSASLSFEQSYSEIDGDSSSLAIFCVLLSSLAKLSIKQNIAITGSIDQMGDIQAVGGVNHKIEGFYDLCKLRQQKDAGVIIPKICIEQLSLRNDLNQAIKNNEFNLWTIDSIEQAVELLFDKKLDEIIEIINNRLDGKNSNKNNSLLTSIFKFKK